MKPKFVIDDHIPYIKGVFESFADIDYLAAKDITPEVVRNADALIIRTRTKCDRFLLDGSSVKLIVTATIGIDHIDTAYCDCHGIVWRNAPGCNAMAVAQWFGSALAVWAKRNNFSLQEKTLGIIGHGHVGSQVESMAKLLGMRVMLNDPIKAMSNPDIYSDLNSIAECCDVISFHTPLTVVGDFKTLYLADMDFFGMLKKSPFLINAARGGVVNERDLLTALDLGLVGECAIDCWENEPLSNDSLRMRALITTPHIAGYSADGKFNASKQAIAAVCEFFDLKVNGCEELPPKRVVDASRDDVCDLLLECYPILKDSEALKMHPELFEFFRSHYDMRREVVLNLIK